MCYSLVVVKNESQVSNTFKIIQTKDSSLTLHIHINPRQIYEDHELLLLHGITFSTCYVCLAYLSGLQEGLGLKLLQIQGHHDEVICTNVHQLLSLMTLYIEEINDDLCAEKICDEEPTTASNRTESFTSRRRPFSMLRYLLSS